MAVTEATLRKAQTAEQARQQAKAQKTWGSLVELAYNAGDRSDLTEKQIADLVEAAEVLGKTDWPAAFIHDIEVLEHRDREVANRKIREGMVKPYDLAQLKAVNALIDLIDARNALFTQERQANIHAGDNGDIAPLAPLGLAIALEGVVTGLPQLAVRAKTILDARADEIRKRFGITSEKWSIFNE